MGSHKIVLYIYIYIYITVSEGGKQQCIHRRVTPPPGTEVDMMGVDRLLQSMTGVGDRAASGWRLLVLLHLYWSIYIYHFCVNNLDLKYVSKISASSLTKDVFSKINISTTRTQEFERLNFTPSYC